MKELIETIVKPLVDFPDDVLVQIKEDDSKITYHLSVNKADIGKVIGKQGRVAKAIRTVVYAAGSSQQKKIFLEIGE
ncbi:KH domain-containing protein [Neobacillus thermocopriae]|uniref:RNA-binding protein KhpA n=1 Tax=Neobacillus thermocopriae TaxID=1215031 RepID=A0A6B3TL63_9BACI|nr:KH domain-containing protein [Neobacillus thermocopriae]MED3624251.1 KH domain-containing protein [Neobacillus thermocopriae]MED3713554.1 KH domain-containing protein [Neobacillus thermocopriae]NEX77664.1 KH domain-containing protein [Neobacillus thermocopriae]